MPVGVLELRESAVAAPHADLAGTESHPREKGLTRPFPIETARAKHAGQDQAGRRCGEC